MVDALGEDWPALRGARLFITGGTGFIGRWMMEALLAADAAHDLGVRATLLTRSVSRFQSVAPHIANHPAITLLEGDIRALLPDEPPGAPFTHIIHAATDASAKLTADQPIVMFDTIVEGTRIALDLAVRNPGSRLLFLSSGAVYGAQPFDLIGAEESWTNAADLADPRSAYGEGKRAAEMLCTLYRHSHGCDIRVARIFAVLGPLLPLDTHFAAGNFIADALAKRTITVKGSGTAVRSLLYAADTAIWLWAMLLRGRDGDVFNVGSDTAVTIAELANETARVLGGKAQILGQDDAGWNPGRYVPSVAKITRALNVRETISLHESIRRTALFNGWNE